MNLAFDLDGTLVDTREANYQAYLAAGTIPHPDHWKIRWEEWCTKEQHDMKQHFFPRMLQLHGRLLPAFEVLRKMGGTILTNASQRSVDSVFKVFPAFDYYGFKIINNLSHDKKIDLLNEMTPGIYFDDLEEMAQKVRRETEWQAVNVSGL